MSKTKQYILVTKGSCPYCNEALSLLKENNLSFSYTDMEFNEEALEAVKYQSDWSTVPIVWQQEVEWGNEEVRVISNNFIGGCSELKKYLEDEKAESEPTEVPVEEAKDMEEVPMSEPVKKSKKKVAKKTKKKVANA